MIGRTFFVALWLAASIAGAQSPSDGALPEEFMKEIEGSEPALSTDPGTPSTAAPPSSAEIPPPPSGPPPGVPATPPPMEPVPSQADPNIGMPTMGVADSGTAGGVEEYVYDPTGRRDPFRPYRVIRTDPLRSAPVSTEPLLEPLQRMEIEGLTILGILWDVRQPRALVRDGAGNLHTLVKNTKVGRNNGYVAAIREGEVVVIETVEEEGRPVKRTKVLELKLAEK